MSLSHLQFFPAPNLAMLSDWLAQAGDLYVDTYEGGGIGVDQYLIRSLFDLKWIARHAASYDRLEYAIPRERQLPLRGVAAGPLLEAALQQFPEGTEFHIAHLAYFPATCHMLGEGASHAELLEILADAWGDPVAIGVPPLEKKPDDDIFMVYKKRSSDKVMRNHETYAPYDADPARYQWIIDMWNK